MRQYVLIAILFLCMTSLAGAKNIVHTDPEEMDSIQKPFAGQAWANYHAETSYTGEIDRRVWMSGQPAPDNSADNTKVLVAKAKPMPEPEKPVVKAEPKPEPKPRIIYVKEHNPEDDIIVTTRWCDTEKEICE